MKKRMLSLGVALVLCLSLAIPTFAVESQVEQESVKAALLAAENSEIYYMDDGTMIIVAVLPANFNLMSVSGIQPLAWQSSIVSPNNGFAYPFELKHANGDCAQLDVRNIDEEGDAMHVQLIYEDENGDVGLEKNDTIYPNERMYIYAESNDGTGLDGYFNMDARAVGDSDTDFEYNFSQYWS